MTSGSTGGEGSSWLLEPPAAGEVHLHISIGEGTELTPEIQAALDQLMAAVHQEDVAGFAAGCWPKCSDLKNCTTMECQSLSNCVPLTSKPCAADVSCKIGFSFLG
jgi:hypothetical protein